ncbi:unnamed protein product, partial [marine sediment metagenome]
SRIVLPASSLDYRGSLLDDKEHLELDDRLILYIPTNSFYHQNRL